MEQNKLSKLFLKTFNIHIGLTINNFKLIDVQIEIIPIITFQKYNFNIKLIFSTDLKDNQIQKDIDYLLNKIVQYTAHYPILYTPNDQTPFQCDFGTVQLNSTELKNNIVLNTCGTCELLND